MRTRYETFLGGRLLKVTDLVLVPATPTAEMEPAAAVNYIDGRYEWRVDDKAVSEDVALAMLDAGDTYTGQPYAGPPVSDRVLVWLLLRRYGPTTLTQTDLDRPPSPPELSVMRTSSGWWELGALQ